MDKKSRIEIVVPVTYEVKANTNRNSHISPRRYIFVECHTYCLSLKPSQLQKTCVHNIVAISNNRRNLHDHIVDIFGSVFRNFVDPDPHMYSKYKIKLRHKVYRY